MAAVSNDLGYEDSQFTMTAWNINPAIGPGSASDKQLTCTDLGPGSDRMTVAHPDNTNPIPDGALCVCTFSIAAGTAVGSYAISNVPGATDPTGNPVPAAGAPGTVVVAACNCDCDGDGVITIGEVVKAVNLFLGQPLCSSFEPARSCPVADTTNNGEVSIGEVVQCVNGFLDGCP